MVMAATPVDHPYYTADMVRALPDDGMRYELVWGELLVSPSPRPRHQRVVGRLFHALTSYCTAIGFAEAMFSPADISWSDDTLVQPDVFVVPRQEAVTERWASIRTLLLVAEVLSPGTARQDRFAKRRLYQEQGVPLLWLIDADRGQVECWTPRDRQPTIVTDRLVWRPAGAESVFSLSVAVLLRPE
jgi:Uma2 family endonuclease